MSDAVAERKGKTIAWSKPFHVEFRVPEKTKGKWEVTLHFDENNNIIAIQHPRDNTFLNPPEDAPEGGGSCPQGSCGRMVAGRLMCSPYYC